MRLQTYYLINIQLDNNDKMDYETFKNQYMRFSWEKLIEEDIPKEIDWDEKDRIDRERRSMTVKQEKFL